MANLPSLPPSESTNDQLIIVKQLPIIEERLRELADSIDQQVVEAVSLVCNEATYKEVKKARAALSAQRKELESKRIAVKNAVLAPYNQFEAIFKECATNKFDAADAILKARIDEVELGIKATKELEVCMYFEEYRTNAGLDFLTWEQLGIKISMSSSVKSLKDAVNRLCSRVLDDLALIKTQPHKDEILVEYKSHLNASLAITTVVSRHEAIEAERRRHEEAAASEEIRRKAIAQVDDALTPPVSTPETSSVPLAPPVVSKPSERPEPPAEAHISPATPNPNRIYSATFTVRATLDKLKALKQFLNDGGYDYE